MTKPLTTMTVDGLTWYSEDDWKVLVAENARLEANLAKAMTTLEYYAGYWADDKTFVRTDDGGELASETIKELTGGKDG